MLTAAQCQALASQYKVMAEVPHISEKRALTLRNIARSFTGLATQLDRLEANIRDEGKLKPPQLTASFP
jgi:hypothetical protein